MRAETSEPISVSGAAHASACAVEEAIAVPWHSAPFARDTAPAAVVEATAPRTFDFAALPQVTRAEQIAVTLAQALANERFRIAATLGDAARDAGDWITAEQQYGCALRLFPLHWGYGIQFAHAIKEQGRYVWAEAWYRSAVALGAPADMVDEHLIFVARLNGVEFVRRGMPVLDVPPMMAPPTAHDIGLLAELTRVPGFSGIGSVLDLLRTVPDNRAALLQMLGMPQFARINRPFLDILRG